MTTIFSNQARPSFRCSPLSPRTSAPLSLQELVVWWAWQTATPRPPAGSRCPSACPTPRREQRDRQDLPAPRPTSRRLVITQPAGARPVTIRGNLTRPRRDRYSRPTTSSTATSRHAPRTFPAPWLRRSRTLRSARPRRPAFVSIPMGLGPGGRRRPLRAGASPAASTVAPCTRPDRRPALLAAAGAPRPHPCWSPADVDASGGWGPCSRAGREAAPASVGAAGHRRLSRIGFPERHRTSWVYSRRRSDRWRTTQAATWHGSSAPRYSPTTRTSGSRCWAPAPYRGDRPIQRRGFALAPMSAARSWATVSASPWGARTELVPESGRAAPAP